MKIEDKAKEIEAQCAIQNVRQRCFEILNETAPDTGMDEKVYGWLDDIDFVEILLNVEDEFDKSIDEGNKRIEDFNKVRDFVNWLADNVA